MLSLRGSMPNPPRSTMAPSKAAAPSRVCNQASTTPSNTSGPPVTKILVKRDYDFSLCAFFPTPVAPMKFNPITAMNHLLRIMLKDEPSLVIRTSNNDKQLILTTDVLPTREKGFKQFFKVSTTVRIEQQHKSHVCIGCNVLSNRTLGNIKFNSNDGNLLAWLKKERVFIESDGLGIDRPVTIGHFLKITPELTHLANFRDNLVNQLMLIDIDADTAIALAPHLKDAQSDAMTNGDEYVTILPPFKIYRTRITHGREPTQVSTDVLGVKSAPHDAKLLGEFFARLASETSNNHRDGIFLPKGAVHQLGLPTYAHMLKENNFFLTQVATVPVNLEYATWFAVIDTTAADNKPISLYEHLLRQPWFQCIESVGRKKCLIVTTRHNLPEARAWIDANLEAMIRTSIPEGIDTPSSLLPKRLDKPVYTKASQSYTDILKQQFSLNSNQQTQNNENNRPPRKRQATVIDYNSDQSANPPLSTPMINLSTSGSCNSTAMAKASPNLVTTTVNYDAELMSIKTELNLLRAIITSAVKQIKNAIASIQVQPLSSRTMETDATPTQNLINLPALIQDLKKDIANIIHKTRTMLNQPLTAMMELDNLSSIT